MSGSERGGPAKPPRQVVALRYEPERDSAPRGVAKGEGLVAERILALAQENGVPVRHDGELTAVLARLDLEQEIPPAVYQVVAEILAFIHRVSGQGAGAGHGTDPP